MRGKSPQFINLVNNNVTAPVSLLLSELMMDEKFFMVSECRKVLKLWPRIGAYLRIPRIAWVGLGTRRKGPDLIIVAGTRWMREARNRSLWQQLGETYVQQWTSFLRQMIKCYMSIKGLWPVCEFGLVRVGVWVTNHKILRLWFMEKT